MENNSLNLIFAALKSMAHTDTSQRDLAKINRETLYIWLSKHEEMGQQHAKSVYRWSVRDLLPLGGQKY